MTLDPEFIEPRRLLAIALDQTGQPVEAEAEFDQLLELIPVEHPEAELIRRRLEHRHSPLKKPASAQ